MTTAFDGSTIGTSFDGAMHTETRISRGRNQRGEVVVRLEVIYHGGSHPSSTVLILAENTAFSLGGQIAALLA